MEANGQHLDPALELEEEEPDIDGPFIVVTGNPVDGLMFWGPFTSLSAVESWEGLTDLEGNRGWIAELQSPELDEEEPDDSEDYQIDAGQPGEEW